MRRFYAGAALAVTAYLRGEPVNILNPGALSKHDRVAVHNYLWAAL